MKIINEKGKLFGLVNIVDLFVLLAILAVAGGVCWKLFAPKVQEAVSPQVEMTSIMRVRGASPFLLAEIERNPQVGKEIVSGNSYTDAVIDSMTIEPYTIQIQTADGRVVTATDPDKMDLVFVVKSQVTKNTPAPKIGTQEVRAGRTFILKTNDFETTANIDSVDFAQ